MLSIILLVGGGCSPPPGTKKSYKKGEDHGGRRWGNTIDPAEVANDWARWPHANVGIACGPESGLFVIEADTIEGHGVDGLASLASLAEEHGGLPETVEALSPSGSRHLYFRWPDGLDIRNSEGRIAPGVDVRGAGGMVIAPPSVKPGKPLPYRWEKAPGIYELAACPEWLVRLCMPKEKPANDSASAGMDASTPRSIASDIDEQVLGWLYTRPNSISRADWVRLCFALKGSIGERARDAWLSFSGRYAGGTTEGEAKRQWETAVPDGQVGIGTAIHLLGGFDRQASSSWRSEDTSDAAPEEPGAESSEPAHEDARAPKKRPVGLADFFAYMPTHTYIFAPTGEFWPGASVNSRIPPVPLFDNDNRPVLNKKDEQVELAANQWIDQHRPVEQMTWAPGHPQVVKDRLISDGGWIERSGCNVFNLYRPPLKAEGDASKAGPWIDHVRRVYPEDADHIINWLAHRAQRPAEKINHAIVMGGCQGVGKDTILEPVKAAIGPWNFQEVSPQQMLGRFTGFAKSIILRISEARDLGDVDRFAFYDHTKVYTAAPPDVLRVDEKHIREYSVFNVCGVIITSNHKTDGIYLPADDRRHYVAWSDLSRDTFGADYWNTLYSWYHDGGIGHVVAYLRHLNISGFDAKAPPKKTAAFWDIVSSNQAPEEAELSDALESLGWPNAVTVASVALYAADAFKDFLLDRRNSRRIPHRFEECGYVQVRNSNAQDGLYKVSGKRCVIYAKKVLSRRDQIAAAERLAYPGGQSGQ